MSRLAFRDAVADRFHTKFQARTDCRVAFENGPKVDMNTTTVPVIAYEIAYAESAQADLSENPRIKDEGTVLVNVMVKDMAGCRGAYTLRDEVVTLLQRQHLAGATMQVAKLLPNSHAVKGWVGYRAAVPFWHYHF